MAAWCQHDRLNTNTYTRVVYYYYYSRYGAGGPDFARGTLSEAYEAATALQRPLLVYLHDDAVIEAHVFCTAVLNNVVVADVLNANFIVWGWDVTHPRGRELLQAACARVHGWVRCVACGAVVADGRACCVWC